jgi:hypothetical protein
MSTDLSTTAHTAAAIADVTPTADVTPAADRPAPEVEAPASSQAGTNAQRAYTRWATWGALIPLAAASYNIWGALTGLGGFDPFLAIVPAVALELAAVISLMGARADAKNGREPRSSEMYVIASISGFVGALHWFVERVGPGFGISDFAWSVGPTAFLLGILSLVWPVLGARALHRAFVGEREAVTGSTRAQRAEAARAARMDRRARHLVHEWAKAREVWRELRRIALADARLADPRKIRAARDAEQAARNRALAAGWFWENGRPYFFEGMTIEAFEAAARVWSELLAAADEHGAMLDTLGVPGAVSPADHVRTVDDATPALAAEAVEDMETVEDVEDEEPAPAPRLLAPAPEPEAASGAQRWESLSRPEQVNLVVSMRNAGRTNEEIAAWAVVSPSTISRRAKEGGLSGVPTSPEGNPVVRVAELVG